MLFPEIATKGVKKKWEFVIVVTAFPLSELSEFLSLCFVSICLFGDPPGSGTNAPYHMVLTIRVLHNI